MSYSNHSNPGDNGGRMSMDEFHNGLRILLSLDFSDLVKAGVFYDWQTDEWDKFQRDPFRFFIRTDEETADALWAAIQARQSKRKAA
jgi:hypothetical protein